MVAGKAAASSSKVGLKERSGKFLRGVWAELKKVHWPDRKTIVIYTGVVLAAIFIMAFAIWIVDSALTFILNRIL
ncbi:preprotein translocase subunit SecE [Dehalobacterium formicoaceticum]|uniref:Protein translocase subunit SecE n=1 Tax=Dehalobacterium formicoaceticum TaxID=51515 RepID=A0ABT1Y162_9FIRM|nr:preprotein translocase subunit SecE [Dehalobacterium formicoaceticum]MCR6543940.1 preprotein translocase subunit SecE [Dehalobacterium formicoaceticum]